MPGSLPQNWDLERFFPGGSSSEAFADFLSRLARDVDAFRTRALTVTAPLPGEGLGEWPRLINEWQDLRQRLQEAGSFARCLTAQNTGDAAARSLMAQVRAIGAGVEAALSRLEAQLAAFPEEAWQALLSDPAVEPVAFALRERRHLAQEKMPAEHEALAVELGVDGYHAWGELYNTVAGRLRIPFEHEGRQLALSVGQAAQRLTDPDPAVRARLAAAFEQAWAQEADIFAAALNHLAGYRLTVYRHRGWDSVLKEPLARNRMERATLDAMWAAVERGQAKLLAYLEWKARLLGQERLGWFDVGVPVGKSAHETISYDEAARFIIEQFGAVSPRLAAFASHALADAWIEAEDRPGKDAGGFCTSFPLRGESRIFLTYAGRLQGMDTLAHELGHAYHFAVIKDLPPLARMYPMNLAETASTLAEMIVADAALKATTDPERRLALLDRRLQRTVTFLMNIYARYRFELEFYAARTTGPLTVAQLNSLMEAAQKYAYLNALGSWHPLFWASKLHFYLTAAPFYNFPYTFGYLFSAAVYARAREAGDRFEAVYEALLRDTGRMRVEDLARTHLGLDLTSEDAWAGAVAIVTKDVDEFVALARRVAGDGTGPRD
ncbi:MAG: oligoendopeptidase [Firmicutes bacterium ZCTH02-B6]|nr:MAG: oligoendopeptidase [Firmicutes bacterium ZCTH02-B6]